MAVEFLGSYYKVYGNTAVSVSGNSVTVQLPTFEDFTIDLDEPDFAQVDELLGISGKLYLYSGEFLTLLASKHRSKSRTLISAFISWMGHDSVQEKSATYMSWDHATSLRIETLVYLREVHHEIWSVTGDSLLRADLEWSMQVRNIKLNNHGVFVLRSLLLASKCLPLNVFAGLKKRVAKIFNSRMSQILDYVYGTDGWCAENSPMYDRVWINLLRQLENHFADQIVEANLAERFEALLEKAELVSRAQLYHGGQFVPRGDTPRRRTNLEPLHGSYYSQRVGVWVYSDQDLYLMATAGHASITHKHVDDTQMLLSYKAVDFFIDGGGTSYDYSDPRIPAIKSMAGHSVLSEQGIDHLPPWRAYSGNKPPLSASITNASDSKVVMENNLGGGGTLTRNVSVGTDNVSVRDEWEFSDPKQQPIIRYLLPETCFIEQQDKRILLYRLGQKITLTFNQRIQIEVISGERKPPYRGWYSVDARNILAGYCLEIQPEITDSAGLLEYRIKMAPMSESETKSVHKRAEGALGGEIQPINAIGKDELLRLLRERSPKPHRFNPADKYWVRGLDESAIIMAAILKVRDCLIGFIDDRNTMHGQVLFGAPIYNAVNLQRHETSNGQIFLNSSEFSRRDFSLQPDTVSPDFAVSAWEHIMTTSTAVSLYRASRLLYETGLYKLSDSIDRYVREVFNAQLPGSASIGEDFLLGGGGSGVVIHPRAIVGDNVTLSPNVVLDGRNRRLGPPKLGDNIFVGANAVFIGGTLGSDTTIGAGAVVLEPVPDNSVAVGNPARII